MGLKLDLHSLDYHTSFSVCASSISMVFSGLSLLEFGLRTFSRNHPYMKEDWPHSILGDAALGAMISFFSSSTPVPYTKHLGWNAWRNIHSQSWICHHRFKFSAGQPSTLVEAELQRTIDKHILFHFLKNGQVALYQNYRRTCRHNSGCLYLDVWSCTRSLDAGKDLNSSRTSLPVRLELWFSVKVKMSQHNTYKT